MSKTTCLPVFCVDAFTKTAFGGNPAAVCLVSATTTNLTETLMQKIAAELNLSETAFIFSEGSKDSFKKDCKFGLRWFTPTTEVNLCGHATLGSAAVLFNKIGNESQEICFNTLSGILTTRRQGKLISMDFPLNPSEKQDRSEMENLLKVVVDPSLVQDLEYSSTTKKLVVRLSDTVTRSELEGFQPQIPRMVESDSTGKVKGVIITLRGSQSNGAVDAEGRGYDFVSRVSPHSLGQLLVKAAGQTGALRSPVLPPGWGHTPEGDGGPGTPVRERCHHYDGDAGNIMQPRFSGKRRNLSLYYAVRYIKQ